MTDRFKAYVKDHALLRKGQRILLAVSGGADSCVMLALFEQCRISYGLAHCNFALRGEESDADERFVKQLAATYGVRLHTKRFETKKFASQKGVSIQMAARQLRYNWFNQLCDQENYDAISVATQLTDQAETMLINQLRGTGLAGMQGILPKRGRIIRPMLFASASEIRNYAYENGISFREDSSNSGNDYLRNRIRHEVLPVLRAYNPSLEQTFDENARHFRDALQIYKTQIEQLKKKWIVNKGADMEIPLKALRRHAQKNTVLFEILSPLHFNASQVSDIINALHSCSGKEFLSRTHRLVKDREVLLVSQRKEKVSKPAYFIEKGQTMLHEPLRMKFLRETNNKGCLSCAPHTALLDYARLDFPLMLRHWKPGDYFYPIGMKGRKKISDFFIDNKVPLTEKERTFVLLSGDRIAWVVGYRTDQRFRVTSHTKQIYRIEVHK